MSSSYNLRFDEICSQLLNIQGDIHWIYAICCFISNSSIVCCNKWGRKLDPWS